MTDTDKAFTGSIPVLYDRYLGPLIFEPYASDMAERVARLGPERILEIAAGTGIVTRALARKLPEIRIVATDLNQAMLNHAAAVQSAAGAITWRQADAQALPFNEGEFDIVVCQFGVMFFPDKSTAYREARRVLRPGGHFVFSVWDRIEENEIADLVSRTVASLFPENPSGFLTRTPYGYHELAAIEATLKHSGFPEVRSETLAKRGRAASARDPAVGFCQGTPLRGEIEARDKIRLEEVTGRTTEAIIQRFGSGPIDSRIQAHVITATR